MRGLVKYVATKPIKAWVEELTHMNSAAVNLSATRLLERRRIKNMTKSSKDTKNTTPRIKVASGSVEIKRSGAQIFVGGVRRPKKKTK